MKKIVALTALSIIVLSTLTMEQKNTSTKPETMKITVNAPNGSHTLQILSTATIKDLKELLFEKEKIPVQDQDLQLFYALNIKRAPTGKATIAFENNEQWNNTKVVEIINIGKTNEFQLCSVNSTDSRG